jgi:hypothetical protein
MLNRTRALLALAGALLLGAGALLTEVAAHPDGCHRWHSCPSDDGSYVCGDRGYCSECPDNQYCLLGRPRNAQPTPTRTLRPTRTPAPTKTPAPTRTPAPTATPRPTEAPAARAARPGPRDGDDGVRPVGSVGRAVASADSTRDELGDDDLRTSAALAGTGAALPAAPPRGVGAASDAPAGPGAARAAPTVMAEYAGIRVLGPLQWSGEGDTVAVTGLVQHEGAEPRTMVLTLFLLDPRGARLGSVDVVLWDLAPGENRPFTQALPPLPTPATDISVRLEPLVP